MREGRTIQGLCQTCMAAKSCSLPNGSATPVWRCEEFSNGNGEMKIENSIVPGSARMTASDLSSARDLGLCSSCASVSVCTFPRSGQGVLHCEEHQS